MNPAFTGDEGSWKLGIKKSHCFKIASKRLSKNPTSKIFFEEIGKVEEQQNK
jgi:hypothetical protein